MVLSSSKPVLARLATSTSLANFGSQCPNFLFSSLPPLLCRAPKDTKVKPPKKKAPLKGPAAVAQKEKDKAACRANNLLSQPKGK